MKVYYGVGKINKIKNKREILILYENQDSFRFQNGTSYQDRFVKRAMHLAYTRVQTKAEERDAMLSNRTFTAYSIFVDEKPFSGSLRKALQRNKDVESGIISEKELKAIYNALEEEFRNVFPSHSEPVENRTLFDLMGI
ncbi:MAG: hypothetical protein ACRCUJ_06570 [Phocaeicola sp.]